MTLLENTKEVLSDVEKVIKYTQTKVASACNEVIAIRNDNNSTQYFSRVEGTDKRTYITSNKVDEIKALEENGYLRQLEKTAVKEKANLEKIKTILEKTPDWKTVYYNIPKGKRHLIEPVSIKPKVSQKDLERWHSYNKPGKEVTSTYVTLNGEHVRSKSEILIADRLKAAGVPYHYESEQGIIEPDVAIVEIWHPDFQMLNLRTGKEYFWEHFGRMDDPDYFADAMYKLEAFSRNNIYIGENLIVTMESSKCPLSTEYVENLINNFLV